MPEVRWKLHGELAAGRRQRQQLRHEPRMILHPLDHRVREDDVPFAAQAFDAADLESQAGARVLASALEHLCGRIDAEHVAVE